MIPFHNTTPFTSCIVFSHSSLSQKPIQVKEAPKIPSDIQQNSKYWKFILWDHVGYSNIFAMLDSISPSFWDLFGNVLRVITMNPSRGFCQTMLSNVLENLFRKLCEQTHLQEVADHVYEHGCGHDDDDENDDKHDYIVNWLWWQKLFRRWWLIMLLWS